MNFLQYLTRWIAENQSVLNGAETLRISDYEGTRPKRAVHIAVQGRDRFVEIIVWDSGEAEFGFGDVGGAQSDEHHELVDTRELRQLLDRFLSRVQAL